MKLIVERVTCRECGGDGYVPHENEEGCGACRGDWGCRKVRVQSPTRVDAPSDARKRSKKKRSHEKRSESK